MAQPELHLISGKKDDQTVKPNGERLDKLPHGLSFHNLSVHVDDRGMVCEMFDPRVGWHPDPLVYSYFYTIRPGMIKGWAVHKRHEDRYFVMQGEMEVVLYDDRPNSPTRGLVSKVYLTEYQRRLMNIPAGIWHANRNVGSKDVIAINFPTEAFNYKDPDKYRLPLDTDKIPYKFSDPRGW